MRVLGGGTPSDASLPALVSESKFSQAPAATKFYASPSQQGGWLLHSQGRRCKGAGRDILGKGPPKMVITEPVSPALAMELR